MTPPLYVLRSVAALHTLGAGANAAMMAHVVTGLGNRVLHYLLIRLALVGFAAADDPVHRDRLQPGRAIIGMRGDGVGFWPLGGSRGRDDSGQKGGGEGKTHREPLENTRTKSGH